MNCKVDGMCKTAAVCFLNGCQAEATTASADELAEHAHRALYSDPDYASHLSTTASASGQELFEAWVAREVTTVNPPRWEDLAESTRAHWNKEATYGRAPAPSRNAAPLDFETIQRIGKRAEFIIKKAGEAVEWCIANAGPGKVPDGLMEDIAERASWIKKDAADLTQQSAAQAPKHQALAGYVVSIDVSTGDDDAGNRIFAELTGETGSDGLTLLAIESSRNFAAQAAHAGADTERLSAAEIGILRFAADALEGMDYEDTAGDLRGIADRAAMSAATKQTEQK